MGMVGHREGEFGAYFGFVKAMGFVDALNERREKERNQETFH